MINTNTSLEELIQIVNETLSDVESGEEFIVKDLFRGFEWNRIPKAMRTKLGSMILSMAENGKLSQNIEPIRKTPQNQQVYKKRTRIQNESKSD